MDYGEPWDNSLGYIRNRDGVDIDGSKQADARAVDCVNACAGIPTEELKNVKRAWVVWQINNGIWAIPQENRVTHDQFKLLNSIESCYVIDYALKLIESGKTFGELDQLIRECR